MPRISIITINKNNAAGLKRTVESVRMQTYTDFEYIVVDGLSNDDSINIIHQNKDIIHQSLIEEDRGIYEAMNKGMRMAKGDYLLFLNSGDELVDANVLQNAAMKMSNTVLYYGNMIISENGKERTGFMPESISALHLYKDTLWHPVTFIKSEFLKQNDISYDENFKIAGDYDLFVKLILKYKVSIKHLGMTISKFYNDGLSSRTDMKMQLQNERYISQKKYFNPLMLFVFRLYSKLRN